MLCACLFSVNFLNLFFTCYPESLTENIGTDCEEERSQLGRKEMMARVTLKPAAEDHFCGWHGIGSFWQLFFFSMFFQMAMTHLQMNVGT